MGVKQIGDFASLPHRYLKRGVNICMRIKIDEDKTC